MLKMTGSYPQYGVMLLFLFFHSIAFSSEIDSINFHFERLDKQLLSKEEQEERKLQDIRSLKMGLMNTSDPEKQCSIYGKLFSEYQSYNYDSAFVCGTQMIRIAEKLGDPMKLVDARLMVAYSCMSAGLFLEAKELLQSVDSIRLDPERKVALFSTYSKLYLDMALAIRHNPYKSFYLKRSIGYSNRIIDLRGRKTSIGKLQQINIYRCREDYAKAIEATKYFLATEKVDDRSRTLCMGGIGTFYLLSGDTLHATAYLTEAAIGDIRNVTKESSALSELATIAFRRGDIEHAYLYIKQGMNDAYFFNARHRKVEASDILPIVEASRFEMMQKQQRNLFVALIFLIFLFLCFLAAMAFILKQMRQLKKARKLIQQRNVDLKEINKRLKDGNKLKDEYIGYFFSLNSAFMDEFDNFRKLVLRKLAGKQYNELLQLVKQEDSHKKRESKFASFDGIFLKLFPDFVRHFNSLFSEKDQILLPSSSVLNTELRIFALIRLGVTDSEHIAKFLDYSVHTINTYKSKTKNRSIVPNNLFEQKIMEIESVKSDID